MSSTVTSIDDEARDRQAAPIPPPPTAILEAMSALQTADALLRWRLRDRLHVRANEMMAIEFIARHQNLGQSVRALDIARALGVTNGAATGIVARLMERGFVARTDNPFDGRGHHLHLTTLANSALADAIGTSRDGWSTLIAGMTPRESKRMVALLAALTASLDHGGVLPAA